MLPATALARRAQAQHGLFTIDQAVTCGLTSRWVERQAERGRFNRFHHGVYAVAGAPGTWEQRVLAAALAADGVVSHRAAGRIWALGEWGDVEVTVPVRRGPRIAGAIVHRSGDIDSRFVTRRAGLPVTNPMRTLVDLGAVAGEHVVADAVERALIARVCGVVALERVLDEVARRGRRGAGVLRRVMDERALGRARPEGLLEARVARVLRSHGLPPPDFQFDVRRGGRLIARVDFAYPDVRLAVEVDGFEVHGTPAAMQHDLERQNRLVAAGWTVLRFTWLDVVRRPEWMAAQVAGVLRGLRAA